MAVYLWQVFQTWDMKKITFSVLFLVFLYGIDHAQQSTKTSTKTINKSVATPTRKTESINKTIPATNVVSTRDSGLTKSTNNLVGMPSQLVLISDMDQRQIYHWDNGQTSTAAGRQADDPSAKYARVFGDSAVVVKDWTEKARSETNGTVKH